MIADFDVFIKVLISIAAGIVAIGGAIGFIEHVIERASIKHNKVAEQVEKHDRALEKHAEFLDNDNKRLQEMEITNKLIMRGVMNIMSHEIDGNHTAQLKQTRDEMRDYLINR